MVFDLGMAMRKKEEFETARLMDFEFRRRARATRLLAVSLGLEENVATSLVATTNEDSTCARLAELAGMPTGFIADEYRRCLAATHAHLVKERGDPTPHRLV